MAENDKFREFIQPLSELESRNRDVIPSPNLHLRLFIFNPFGIGLGRVAKLKVCIS